MRGTRRTRTFTRKRKREEMKAWRFERILAALDSCGLKETYSSDFEMHEMDDDCVEKSIDNLQELLLFLDSVIPKAGHKLQFVLAFRKTKTKPAEIEPQDEQKDEQIEEQEQQIEEQEQQIEEQEQQKEEQEQQKEPSSSTSFGTDSKTVEPIQDTDVSFNRNLSKTITETEEIPLKTEESEGQMQVEHEEESQSLSFSFPSAEDTQIMTTEPEDSVDVNLMETDLLLNDTIPFKGDLHDETTQSSLEVNQSNDDYIFSLSEGEDEPEDEITIISPEPMPPKPKLKELRVIVKRMDIDCVLPPRPRHVAVRGRRRRRPGPGRSSANIKKPVKSEPEVEVESCTPLDFDVSFPGCDSPSSTTPKSSKTWRKTLNRLEEGEKNDPDKVCLNIISYLTFLHADKFPVKKEIAFAGWILAEPKLEKGLYRLEKKYKLISIQEDNLIQLYEYPDPLLDLDADFNITMPIRDPWDSKLIYLSVKIGPLRQFQPLITSMINSCIQILNVGCELNMEGGNQKGEEMLENFLLIAQESELGHGVVDYIPLYWDFLFQLALNLMKAERYEDAFPLFSRVAQICQKEYGANDDVVLMAKENMAAIETINHKEHEVDEG